MNKQGILQYVDNKFQKKEAVDFRVGDTVRGPVKIMEGDAIRVQVFEGTVIAMKGGGARNFTVRKISFGVGVERTFPLNSPTLEKIDVVRSGHTRRAKHYYLRFRVGRAAKLEEKESIEGQGKTSGSSSAPKAAPVKAAPPVVAAEEK